MCAFKQEDDAVSLGRHGRRTEPVIERKSLWLIDAKTGSSDRCLSVAESLTEQKTPHRRESLDEISIVYDPLRNVSHSHKAKSLSFSLRRGSKLFCREEWRCGW